MYPIITFPCCKVVGVEGQAITVKPNSVSFRATMGQDGAILLFNAFDGAAKLVESMHLDSGSLFTATCAITHYEDAKGVERDSYKVISIQKLSQGTGAYPTVFFQAVKVRKMADGTSSKGASYKTLVAEEQIPVKGKYPVRIFNAWDECLKSIDVMKLKPGYTISVVAEMRTYFDKKSNKLQTSYKMLQLSYLPKREEKKETEEEKVSEVKVPEPVLEEVVPVADPEPSAAEETKTEQKEIVVPEFKVSEFDALFA